MKQNSTKTGHSGKLLGNLIKHPPKPRRGRPPVNLTKLLAAEGDPQELSPNPVSVRLPMGIEAALRIASGVSGRSIQDLIGQCVQRSYRGVVEQSVRSNRAIYEVLRAVLD